MSDDREHVFDYVAWDTGIRYCRHPDHRAGASATCWEASAREAGWVGPEEYRADVEAWREQASKTRVAFEAERRALLAANLDRQRAELKLARFEALADEFHGQALSASRDSEACDPGDPAQGAYWGGQADAWLEAESSIRSALEGES